MNLNSRPAAVFWVTFFWWSNASAHGGVSIEFDKCVLKIGSYLIHFTGYQPETSGGTELCEHIPLVRHTIITMDFVDPELRKLDVDLKIVQADSWTVAQAYRAGEGGKEVLYYPAKKYDRGSITVDHNFSEPGYFVAIVTDNHQKIASVFPFSVGYGIHGDRDSEAELSNSERNHYAEVYGQALIYFGYLDFCKSAVPANASRYGAAQAAWGDANKDILERGEPALRSKWKEGGASNEDIEKFFDQARRAMVPSGSTLELREGNALQQMNGCNHLVEQLEHLK